MLSNSESINAYQTLYILSKNIYFVKNNVAEHRMHIQIFIFQYDSTMEAAPMLLIKKRDGIGINNLK